MIQPIRLSAEHWRWDILLAVACIAFFLLFPTLDLSLSHVFYGGYFQLDTHPVVLFQYHVFAKIHIIIVLFLLWCMFYTWFKRKKKRQKAAIYLLMCLIIGPGVIANTILKDNSFGRPRPVHLVEFGSTATYTPAFYYSGECKTNCSFVSGHASIGFFLMSLFWLTKHKRWLIIGIIMGSLIGLARMLQGAHFLSDIIFSGWVVYFTCSILDKLMQPGVKTFFTKYLVVKSCLTYALLIKNLTTKKIRAVTQRLILWR